MFLKEYFQFSLLLCSPFFRLFSIFSFPSSFAFSTSPIFLFLVELKESTCNCRWSGKNGAFLMSSSTSFGFKCKLNICLHHLRTTRRDSEIQRGNLQIPILGRESWINDSVLNSLFLQFVHLLFFYRHSFILTKLSSKSSRRGERRAHRIRHHQHCQTFTWLDYTQFIPDFSHLLKHFSIFSRRFCSPKRIHFPHCFLNNYSWKINKQVVLRKNLKIQVWWKFKSFQKV